MCIFPLPHAHCISLPSQSPTFSPSKTQSRSQNYVTTNGQPASLSWCQAPIWAPIPDLYYCQLRVCRCGAPSLMRGRVCRIQLLLVLASAVILGSKSCGTHDHILLSQTRDSPNLEGHVPVFLLPRNRVAQLYPQVLGFLFVASYDSQGYGGSILTRLYTGLSKTRCVSATKPNRLLLFRERIIVYCENHTEHTNPSVGRMFSFNMLKRLVYIVTTGL
jgi:hypothetical protein